VAHVAGVPVNGYTMLLLKILCMAGRGSVATNMWGAVFPGIMNGKPDLSKSSIVSMVFVYLMGMSIDRRVDLRFFL
jgi:hypothetical protein